MKSYPYKTKYIIAALVCIIGIAIYMVGCSEFSAPTASQNTTDSQQDLWNPQPGDQVVPGREVPILEEGYWESLYGPQVNPSDNAGAARIGPEGGMLVVGLHSLIVPPGALDAETEVTFRLNFASLTGVGVDCSPGGLIFNVPVILTLSYVGTQYEGLDNVELQIFFMPDDGELIPLPITIDTEANTVTAGLDHFSRYILG